MRLRGLPLLAFSRLFSSFLFDTTYDQRHSLVHRQGAASEWRRGWGICLKGASGDTGASGGIHIENSDAFKASPQKCQILLAYPVSCENSHSAGTCQTTRQLSAVWVSLRTSAVGSSGSGF